MAGNSKTRRCADLATHIEDTFKLVRQYEQQRMLTDDPRTKLRAEHTIKDLREQMAGYEQERAQLGCEETVGAIQPDAPVEIAILPAPVEPAKEHRQLSLADRSKLTELLFDSGRAAYASRTALCIEIGVDPGRLTFMQASDRDFAIQLVAQLHKTGNMAALQQLCEAMAPELGGESAARLAEIQGRLG
jgi:hypothetical protein